MTSERENVCILLAGGKGTRLSPLLPNTPKCLAPVGDKFFLDIQIEHLANLGIPRFVLALGHLSSQIIEILPRIRERAKIDFVVEQQPLGTGGALKSAMIQLGIDECIVGNADTFIDAPLGELLRPLDRDSGEMSRIGVVWQDDRTRFGGVSVDSTGLVTGFAEKTAREPGYINAGLSRINKSALCKDVDQFSLETDVLEKLVCTRSLHAAILRPCREFTDIGVPADYLQFVKNHGER